MSEIGIYILTYPGDYYLSTALVRSLNRFAPDVPIMIIPGEGVDRSDHPFNVPIMQQPTGFWGQIGHADRKFWSFQGPFEKFIYFDADIICTRSMENFVQQLLQKSGKFLKLQIAIDDESWHSAISDANHPMHNMCVNRVHSQLGNVELLRKFDPDFDPFGHYTFNDGIFASSRLTIPEEAFEELNNREKEFFKKQLKKDFNWKSFDLFFGDQGRMNYLVDRLGLERSTLFPYGNYQWGGDPKVVSLNKVKAGTADCNFVHWAGCPRPSPSFFCKAPLLPLLTLAYSALPADYRALKEIPAYSVWRYFSGQEQKRRETLKERFKWSWHDLKHIVNTSIRRLIRNIKRITYK